MPEPPRAFDPVTGDWLPAPSAAPPWNPEARSRSVGARVWDIVLAIDLAVIAGLFALEYFLGGQGGEVSGEALYWSQGIVFVLMGVVPFLWVVGTRVGGLHGAMHYLRLEQPLRTLPWGLLLGFACFLGVVLLSLALAAVGYEPENPQVEALGQVMTWPLAIFLALGAAIGEEILFRGVLQRWLGVWGQAALFGLAHAGYGTPLQVILPFLLGLGFGFLVKRGHRLWVPIGAHFVFNFIQFGLAMVARDLVV